MPNICHNTITIFGPQNVTDSFKAVVKGGENTDFLKALIPPEENADREWFKKNWFDNREGRVLGEWREEGQNTFSLDVDTAWGPPYEPLIEVSKAYHNLRIKLTCESFESVFCGYVIFENGIDVENVYWAYGNINGEDAIQYARKIFGSAMVDEGKFYE